MQGTQLKVSHHLRVFGCVSNLDFWKASSWLEIWKVFWMSDLKK
jgi:hypothetical protein